MSSLNGTAPPQEQGASTRLPRVEPVDTARVPEVGTLLRRLGFGELHGDDLVSYHGRNDNWAGTTECGHGVFVKRVGGGPEESLRRLRRVSTCETMMARAGDTIRRPRCLGYDEETRLLAFEWLADSRSGAELASAEEFDEELSAAAGRMVGRLHTLSADPELFDGAPFSFPPQEWLDALPLGMFSQSCAAELEAWRLLQRDRELTEAVARLRERETPAAPVHGDLRLDQFLRHDGEVCLLDWEEFRWGDPARDVGGFAGEWLYRAVLGLAASPERQGPMTVDPSVEGHAGVVARGTRELNRLRPRITAFWNSYLQARDGAPDRGLAERATAFAGWHMIDRLIAGARGRNRLTGVERAAAGIGRTAVLSPGDVTGVLGLDNASGEAVSAS